MAKPHWFPFYVSDFLSSPTVTMMSAEEVGGYVLLLCYAWQDPNGSIPADDDSVRILSRVKGDLLRIKSCFTEKKGRLYNNRLTQELEKAQAKSDLARKSNALRWQYERKANAKRTQSSSQSQSESQSESQLQSESEVRSQKKNSDCKPPSALANGSITWTAYSDEYQRRYGVLPIRNAKVNSCLKSFMSRVPEKEAPDIASFYVRHPGAYYVSRGHPVELLLRDAEKLRTEWASNKTITQKQAQQSDGRAARGQMWQEVIQELDAEKRGKA